MKSTSISSSLSIEDARLLEHRLNTMPVSMSGFIRLMIRAALYLDEAKFKDLALQTPESLAVSLQSGV